MSCFDRFAWSIVTLRCVYTVDLLHVFRINQFRYVFKPCDHVDISVKRKTGDELNIQMNFAATSCSLLHWRWDWMQYTDIMFLFEQLSTRKMSISECHNELYLNTWSHSMVDSQEAMVLPVFASWSWDFDHISWKKTYPCIGSAIELSEGAFADDESYLSC